MAICFAAPDNMSCICPPINVKYRHAATWRTRSAIYMPASIIAEPKTNQGVICSPSTIRANNIVVIGLKYTQLVALTAPRLSLIHISEPTRR